MKLKFWATPGQLKPFRLYRRRHLPKVVAKNSVVPDNAL